jgi:hypothetical protein
METIAMRRLRTLATSKGNSSTRNVTDPDDHLPHQIANFRFGELLVRTVLMATTSDGYTVSIGLSRLGRRCRRFESCRPDQE